MAIAVDEEAVSATTTSSAISPGRLLGELGSLGPARVDARGWLLAAALSEATDALAVLAVARQLPTAQRTEAAACPAALAVIGFALARRLRPWFTNAPST